MALTMSAQVNNLIGHKEKKNVSFVLRMWQPLLILFT